MKKSDVIVIGAGLAGLTAAAAVSLQGHSVTLLAKGAGTLAFGGGTIDVLGCYDGRGLRSPNLGFEVLPAHHPYTIAGKQAVIEAMFFFQKLCTEAGYPLEGSLESNVWVPTVAGTFKPSCLVPKTMNAADLAKAEHIQLAAFAGLKDFYPSMIMKGLQRVALYAGKEYHTVPVETYLAPGRDITVLDIARWMNTMAGQNNFVSQVKEQIVPGSYLLVPPVLGTEPNYDIWQHLQERLNCRIIEMAAPPPGITGMRLRTLLLRLLKKRKVTHIEQAHVSQAEVQSGCCRSVTTKHFGREQTYEGDAFILATGGFLGGGLVAEPLTVKEAIFGLPVASMLAVEQAAGDGLLNAGPVFQSGVNVDGKMRPLDLHGNLVLENVHLAGNILAGYDYCAEKSGNGVAVVTAYQAAMAAVGR